MKKLLPDAAASSRHDAADLRRSRWRANPGRGGRGDAKYSMSDRKQIDSRLFPTTTARARECELLRCQSHPLRLHPDDVLRGPAAQRKGNPDAEAEHVVKAPPCGPRSSCRCSSVDAPSRRCRKTSASTPSPQLRARPAPIPRQGTDSLSLTEASRKFHAVRRANSQAPSPKSPNSKLPAMKPRGAAISPLKRHPNAHRAELPQRIPSLVATMSGPSSRSA